MSDVRIEVINEPQEELTGVVINGIPYLYWLRAYKALGLTVSHAQEVIKRLTPEKHYVRITKQELREKYPTIHTACIVDYHASVAYFLTEEGLNRAIIEIRTSEMDNPDVIAMVEKRKDEMANIYTRYRKGEVLSIADEHPALPGIVESPPVDKILGEQMGIAKVMIGIGVEPSIAHTIAFSVTESICNCGDTLTPWKNLVRTDPSMIEPALLTPTDIGKSLGGMSARTVNSLLERFGFQEKMGKEWVPTILGKMYSRLIPQEIKHNRGMVRKLQIKWQPSIVEKIREKMYYDQKGQTGLFTGHVGV
jgi:hypothetical protein